MGTAARRHNRRLLQQAQSTFVGRDQELSTLASVLGDEGPLALFIYGTAGVGKSALLEVFCEYAESRGAQALLMDCRVVEPTERGFLDELGRLAGCCLASVRDAVEVLDRSDRRLILALDHFDAFLLLDTWLRQEFLPAMPDCVRLLVAGRQAPAPLWLTSPKWHGLFRSLALEQLETEAALSLLHHLDLPDPVSQRLAAATHGNPLALKLAASAAIARPSVKIEDAAIQEVMQELAALNLADVPDPEIRQAVRLTSVARRITRSILEALGLPERGLYEKLRRLPFIDTWCDGLRIHDAVREAVAATLRASDPGLYLDSRRRVWKQLRAEALNAPRCELWRYTADMLYLIENRVVREAFFPSGRQELAVEPAKTDSADDVRRIARTCDGSEGTKALETWWQHHPEAFRVVRNSDGLVVAFYCMLEASRLSASVVKADPIAEAWIKHLEYGGFEGANRALLLRRWLGEVHGEAPSAEQAACWLDVKRAYMELRPELRRVYLTVVDLATYAPVATELGFVPLPAAAIKLGGTEYQSAMLDFGPDSVDGWIAKLVGAELGIPESEILDRDLKALSLDGESVPLTPLEFKLAEYLEELGGATASRDQILDRVWGNLDSTVSSNVVDAVVKSLRRKMRDKSSRLETVRGFGYRWRDC